MAKLDEINISKESLEESEIRSTLNQKISKLKSHEVTDKVTKIIDKWEKCIADKLKEIKEKLAKEK